MQIASIRESGIDGILDRVILQKKHPNTLYSEIEATLLQEIFPIPIALA